MNLSHKRFNILLENIAVLENFVVLGHCSVKTLPGFYKRTFKFSDLYALCGIDDTYYSQITLSIQLFMLFKHISTFFSHESDITVCVHTFE